MSPKSSQKSSQWILVHQELIKKVKLRDQKLVLQDKLRSEIVTRIKSYFLIKKTTKSQFLKLNHAARIIQKTWKNYLNHRYQYLGLHNLNDCDPVTLAEIRLIPKTDLLIMKDSFGKPRGFDLFQFLTWISRFSYLEMPSDYHRKKLNQKELEWIINHSRRMIQIKISFKNYNQKYWSQVVDQIEKIHFDRLNPERVHRRFINFRDRKVAELIAQHQKWSDLITYSDLLRYLESTQLNQYQVPSDLEKIINQIPLKDLSQFQLIKKDLDWVQGEIKKFNAIFY